MSISIYLTVFAGFLLLIIGASSAYFLAVELYRGVKFAAGFPMQASIRLKKFFGTIIYLAVALAGFAILREGYPFSFKIIAWFIRILGWFVLIVAIATVIGEIGTLRLQKAPAYKYRGLVTIPIVIVAVIALSTYFCKYTKDAHYYKEVIASLTTLAPLADSQALPDSLPCIKPGFAVFNINAEPIKVGWKEKTKKQFTIDDDVAFKLPRKILTRKIENVHTAALLDWIYIYHGSSWYQRTRNGLAVGEPYEVKSKQICCRLTLVDVVSKRVIDQKEFKGSLPGANHIGSDPTKDIVHYLKSIKIISEEELAKTVHAER